MEVSPDHPTYQVDGRTLTGKIGNGLGSPCIHRLINQLSRGWSSVSFNQPWIKMNHDQSWWFTILIGLGLLTIILNSLSQRWIKMNQWLTSLLSESIIGTRIFGSQSHWNLIIRRPDNRTRMLQCLDCTTPQGEFVSLFGWHFIADVGCQWMLQVCESEFLRVLCY